MNNGKESKLESKQQIDNRPSNQNDSTPSHEKNEHDDSLRLRLLVSEAI